MAPTHLAHVFAGQIAAGALRGGAAVSAAHLPATPPPPAPVSSRRALKASVVRVDATVAATQKEDKQKRRDAWGKEKQTRGRKRQVVRRKPAKDPAKVRRVVEEVLGVQ